MLSRKTIWRRKNPKKVRAARLREYENKRKRKLEQLFNGPIPKKGYPQQPRTDLSVMTAEERRLHRNARARQREKLGPVFGRARPTNLKEMTPEERIAHRNKLQRTRYHNGGQTRQLKASEKWRTKNPEKQAAIHRRVNLNRYYSITPEDYDAMVLAQEDRCAICKTSKKGSKRIKFWPIDHDKITGQVRGLLCSQCNHGIGHFYHDIKLLEAAIQYLHNSYAGPTNPEI